MTSKPNSAAVLDGDAAFHAVEWVREVRDRMYAATSALSAEELIKFVRAAATASDVGVKFGGSSPMSAPHNDR